MDNCLHGGRLLSGPSYSAACHSPRQIMLRVAALSSYMPAAQIFGEWRGGCTEPCTCSEVFKNQSSVLEALLNPVGHFVLPDRWNLSFDHDGERLGRGEAQFALSATVCFGHEPMMI